jgi:ABC-type phosphonate transport system ATPase subunit
MAIVEWRNVESGQIATHPVGTGPFAFAGQRRGDSVGVSVQPRILDPISQLQQELGLTFLFIGHDLAVIQQVSHDVLVMRAGEAVEYRPAADLFAALQYD